jgi:hypothetical protein
LPTPIKGLAISEAVCCYDCYYIHSLDFKSAARRKKFVFSRFFDTYLFYDISAKGKMEEKEGSSCIQSGVLVKGVRVLTS